MVLKLCLLSGLNNLPLEETIIKWCVAKISVSIVPLMRCEVTLPIECVNELHVCSLLCE